MTKNILDMLYGTKGVIETLGAITPEQVEMHRRPYHEQVVELHNLVDDLFYQSDGHTAYELRIDFDPKKWGDLTYFDVIHKDVRNMFYNTFQRKAQYVLMREWGTQGGRLHYHGIVTLNDEGNQTQMAKAKLWLVRNFGKRSKITHLTYPMSYIPYMLKRFLTEKLVMSSEIICSYPIVSMVHDYKYGQPRKETRYSFENIRNYMIQRDEAKLLKPNKQFKRTK